MRVMTQSVYTALFSFSLSTFLLFPLLFFSRWGVDLLIHVLTLGDFLFWLSILNACFLIIKRKGKTFFLLQKCSKMDCALLLFIVSVDPKQLILLEPWT